MEGEYPSLQFLCLGRFQSGDLGTLGKSREEAFVLDDLLPGIGGIEYVFRKLLGGLSEFGGKFLESGTLVIRQIGPGLREICHEFIEQPLFLAIQGLGFLCPGKCLDLVPKLLVE